MQVEIAAATKAVDALADAVFLVVTAFLALSLAETAASKGGLVLLSASIILAACRSGVLATQSTLFAPTLLHCVLC